MLYVTEDDFLQVIDQGDLDLLKAGGDLTKSTIKAVEEVASYLAVDYDIEAIFDADEPVKSEMLAGHVVDIALYHLHAKINPRQIPELRVQRRDDAVKWLREVADPRTNITAPQKLPRKNYGERKGSDISWNSRNKRQNHY